MGSWRSCETCAHWDPTAGQCALHDWTTPGNDWCYSWRVNGEGSGA